MTRDDAPAFYEALAKCAVTLGVDVAVERQVEYFHKLCDLELDDLLVGLDRAAGECKFFPQPIEIRERAKNANGYDRLGPPVPPPYRLSVRLIEGPKEEPVPREAWAEAHARLRRIKAENDAKLGPAPEPVLPKPAPRIEVVEKPDPFATALKTAAGSRPGEQRA